MGTNPIATLNIPGPPVPKGRPRTGQGRIYTPAATRDYEEKVGWVARRAMAGRKPTTAYVRVAIDLYGPEIAAADVDNCAKSLLDGMQKIVFVNDAQVDDLHVRRHRGTPDPRAVVVVRELT